MRVSKNPLIMWDGTRIYQCSWTPKIAKPKPGQRAGIDYDILDQVFPIRSTNYVVRNTSNMTYGASVAPVKRSLWRRIKFEWWKFRKLIPSSVDFSLYLVGIALGILV